MWWYSSFLDLPFSLPGMQVEIFFQESKLYIATSPHYLGPLRSSLIFFPNSISPFSILSYAFTCGSLLLFSLLLPAPHYPISLSFISYYVSGIVLGSRDRAMKPRRLLILCHLYSVRRGRMEGEKDKIINFR